MTKPSQPFPKNFLWGAATAAHQVEGGNHNQWTVWELENAKVRAAQAPYNLNYLPTWEEIKQEATNPNNYVSGELADHYHRYKEDFDFLQKMNMNAYRFGVEWSRIEPNEGVWNPAELAHYKEYISELRRRDIEPIVTLFHFTLPVWFADKGGFEKRANVKYFVRFAEKVMAEIGTDVRFIITLNEPEIYAYESYMDKQWPPAQGSPFMFWRVINNLAYAHRRSAKVLHRLNHQYRISIAKNSAFFYPEDNTWASRVSAKIGQYIEDDYVMRKFIRHCDFIGVNYYLSVRMRGFRAHNPDERLSDLHWDMQPNHIRFALERLSRKYKKPLLVTENGLADANDKYRKWWLQETLVGLSEARKHGVKLIGYLHWSLMDNFEWAYGKWPRFGLVAVDYKTGKRTLRPSAVWFGRVIKRLRGV